MGVILFTLASVYTAGALSVTETEQEGNVIGIRFDRCAISHHLAI